MLQTLLICFRGGLKAPPVVAIATLYLRKTMRLHLLMPLRTGVAAAALLSLVLERRGSAGADAHRVAGVNTVG